MYDRAPSSYTFWYPIPVPRTQKPKLIRQWAPILYCKAWRGYLNLGDLLPKQEDDQTKLGPKIENDDHWGHCIVHSLRNRDGKWAGILYLHNPTKIGDEKNGLCELILISGGFIEEDADEDYSAQIPEWNYKERPRLGDQYYFYHALLIEWQGNIAYRKGLGRVVKEIWDDLSKDEVEVFLG